MENYGKCSNGIMLNLYFIILDVIKMCLTWAAAVQSAYLFCFSQPPVHLFVLLSDPPG